MDVKIIIELLFIYIAYSWLKDIFRSYPQFKKQATRPDLTPDEVKIFNEDMVIVIYGPALVDGCLASVITIALDYKRFNGFIEIGIAVGTFLLSLPFTLPKMRKHSHVSQKFEEYKKALKKKRAAEQNNLPLENE